MMHQQSGDVIGRKPDGLGSAGIEMGFCRKEDSRTRKLLRRYPSLDEPIFGLGFMIRQGELKRKFGNRRIREVRQGSDDAGPADDYLTRRPQEYRLPDPYISIAYFGDPVPADGAEHCHILADVAVRPTILLKC